MKGMNLAFVLAATLAATGCGGEGRMMTTPGPTGMPTASAALTSVSPGGGAMGVPVGTSLELRWGVAMGAGMQQFVDLHQGDLSGPVIPMSCAWSGDQTTLVCTPLSPLEPAAQYTIHVGGGMVDVDGQVVDMDMYGPGFGGQWIQGGMMGGLHAGMAWGMMGGGWRHSNGAYGMAFTFTTAA